MFGTARNCNDFFKSRPPMVIFLICLVVMWISCAYFTLYVKYNEDILNTDAKENWISLVRHLNGQNLCVGNDSLEEIKEFDEEISFLTLINFNTSDFDNTLTKVEVYYNLKDWHPYCSSKPESPLYLTLTFEIPENETNIICAIIKGPKQYLPKDSAQSCDLSQQNQGEENATIIYSNSNTSFCPSETNLNGTRILFDSDNYISYLSRSDKNLIYVHLVWCSCILLLVILIILIYAMFYQSGPELLKMK